MICTLKVLVVTRIFHYIKLALHGARGHMTLSSSLLNERKKTTKYTLSITACVLNSYEAESSFFTRALSSRLDAYITTVQHSTNVNTDRHLLISKLVKQYY